MLVRAIDKKHFDSNFNMIDFDTCKLQTLPKHKKYIANFLYAYKDFGFIVGINAFGSTPYKLAPQDFALLAKHLATRFPKVLFVMMT